MGHSLYRSQSQDYLRVLNICGGQFALQQEGKHQQVSMHARIHVYPADKPVAHVSRHFRLKQVKILQCLRILQISA
jgi:hypothetical protein